MYTVSTFGDNNQHTTSNTYIIVFETMNKVELCIENWALNIVMYTFALSYNTIHSEHMCDRHEVLNETKFFLNERKHFLGTTAN